jgi:hypothetical protein
MEKRQENTDADAGKIGKSAQEIEFALNPALYGNSTVPDDPPEGGYGWVVCGAVSLINGFTWGVAAVRSYHYRSSTHQLISSSTH